MHRKERVGSATITRHKYIFRNKNLVEFENIIETMCNLCGWSVPKYLSINKIYIILFINSRHIILMPVFKTQFQDTPSHFTFILHDKEYSRLDNIKRIHEEKKADMF